MVVIAIIIILAAIAIPNYLKMTERAKRSRLQSDMATLATCLETFKTDWGKYPTVDYEPINTDDSYIRKELGGTDSASSAAATINVDGETNAVGENGGIEYIKDGTLTSMVNPFDTAAGAEIQYGSADGDHWCLYVDTEVGDTLNIMYRTDNSSTPMYCATAAIPAEP
jgi:type II secretory pathway pseudopilin PulG